MNVKHKETRILRECLAKVFRKSHPVVQKDIMTALKLYSLHIREYCEHVDRVFIESEKKEVCLDCGVKRNPKGFELINGEKG